MCDTKSEIDAVIEAHRLKVGAEKITISIGPNATAQSVQEFFDASTKQNSEFAEFTELELAHAQIRRLRDSLSSVFKLHQVDAGSSNQLSEREVKVRSKVFELCDLIVDRSPDDLVWLKEQRSKKKKISYKNR
jgi:hypothetical protein